MDQTSSDLLNGTKVSDALERELARGAQAKIPLLVQAGTFRGTAERPLVRVVLQFPWDQLSHSWDTLRGKFTAQIGILGAVYAGNGNLVTRFSDLLWPAYWPTVVGGYQNLIGVSLLLADEDAGAMAGAASYILERRVPVFLPTRFETQLDLDPGGYDLRVVLSDNKNFGRAETHLNIEKYDDKALAVSSVMLCKRYRDAHVAAVERAAANFAPQYVPMVSKGMEVTPAGDLRFKEGEPLIPYFEIYEPLLASQPDTKVQARIRILDANTGAVVKDFPPIDAAPYMNPGSTTIPIAREVPFKELPKGTYKLEVQASDSAGRSAEARSAEFTVE